MKTKGSFLLLIAALCISSLSFGQSAKNKGFVVVTDDGRIVITSSVRINRIRFIS